MRWQDNLWPLSEQGELRCTAQPIYGFSISLAVADLVLVGASTCGRITGETRLRRQCAVCLLSSFPASFASALFSGQKTEDLRGRGRGRFSGNWCSGGDLNPHAFRHTPLKRTCLPFHHPSGAGKIESGTQESKKHVSHTHLPLPLPLSLNPNSMEIKRKRERWRKSLR